MEVPLCFSVGETQGGTKKTLFNKKIIKCVLKETYEDIVDRLLDDVEIDDGIDDALNRGDVVVAVQSNTCDETFTVEFHDLINTVYSFQKNLKFVNVNINVNNIQFCSDADTSSKQESRGVNALSMVMKAWTETKKAKLKESTDQDLLIHG